MAAAAHLCSSISFSSAGNAHGVPTSVRLLSLSRLPYAQLGKSRHAVVRAHATSCGGDGPAGEASARRPRFLCLHGFRTSGEILRRQVTGKWPADVTRRLDLSFPDGPFPAEGESPVAGVFDPPYYEWFRFGDEKLLKYRNFDECLASIEELMVKEGPFDGLLGFSQGGLLAAALAGFQEQGFALQRVPKVRYVVVISGGKIQWPELAAKAYANSDKIKCLSLHFIGENDFVKTNGEELAESFVDPIVIRHPAGHTVARLDEKSLQVMLSYLDKIEQDLSRHSSTNVEKSSSHNMNL